MILHLEFSPFKSSIVSTNHPSCEGTQNWFSVLFLHLSSAIDQIIGPSWVHFTQMVFMSSWRQGKISWAEANSQWSWSCGSGSVMPSFEDIQASVCICYQSHCPRGTIKYLGTIIGNLPPSHMHFFNPLRRKRHLEPEIPKINNFTHLRAVVSCTIFCP